MRVEANDRRFNVCPRQEQALLASNESGEELLATIESELQDFADYLMSRDADQAKARRALDNRPKRLLQTGTQTAIEEVAKAMREGDLAYFVENRPAAEVRHTVYSRDPVFDGTSIDVTSVYRESLGQAIDAAEAGIKHVVRHVPLFAVFELLVGDMPKTKAKLHKRLGHQNLAIEAHAQGQTSSRGFGVYWKASPEQIATWRAALTEETSKGFTLPERSAKGRGLGGEDKADGADQ